MQTPIGRLGLTIAQECLLGIKFLSNSTWSSFQETVSPSILKIQEALEAYFINKTCNFDLPILVQGSVFQKSVWNLLQKIPFGRTITYGEVAKKLNTSPRAVGQACRQNPIPIVIPCHRVVSANGLGGFLGSQAKQSITIKSWLLSHESIGFT